MIKELWKLQAGKFRYPVETWVEGNHRFLAFSFNKEMIAEIKQMKNPKWHGYDPINPRKIWSVEECERNRFQLDFLRGLNPYARYDEDLSEVAATIPKTRFNHFKQKHLPLFKHQPEGIAHILVRRQCIIAGEMGTSKSLMALIAMELASNKQGGNPEWWYVSPKSGLAAVDREWRAWGGFIRPKWMTYEGLVKEMKNWTAGRQAPFGVILDEASKVRNLSSQRSQAAMSLADGIRQDWADDGYIVLMSGSPAPKSPADWFGLAEIARPGFLKEGDIYKFKNRLGIIIQKKEISGGSYPQLVTWRDNPLRCNICGKFQYEDIHQPELALYADAHEFAPSINEVAKLYERLKGLVVVYFKKNCLDLPEKQYRVIELPPKQSTIRAANLIAKSSPTTIQALTRLRELSDGFQYVDSAIGKQDCSLCQGTGKKESPEEEPNSCPACLGQNPNCGNHTPKMKIVLQECPNCGGIGQVTKYKRTIKEVETPKEQAIIDLLEEMEDVGRIIIFAGFTGSIDRCVRICLKYKWAVIRMDHGPVKIMDGEGNPILEKDFLSIFQDRKEEFPKVAFVAHPKSGGMGLTLTASPLIVYYSNTFDAEDRIQSEDRHHRAGMDSNRGATIADLIHLPSDQKILDNLKAKRDLQSMTLGDFYTIEREDHGRGT